MWSMAGRFETAEPPVAAEREVVSRGCRERGGRRYRGQTLRGYMSPSAVWTLVMRSL